MAEADEITRLLEQFAGEDDIPRGLLSEELREQIDACIPAYGFTMLAGCVCQREDEINVSFTVGFSKLGLPEIALSAVPPRQAHRFFTDLLIRLLSAKNQGLILPEHDTIDVPELAARGFRTVLRRLPSIPASRQLIPQAREYLGQDVDVFQMLPADENNRFPWEGHVSDRFATGQAPLIDWAQVGPPKAARTMILPEVPEEMAKEVLSPFPAYRWEE